MSRFLETDVAGRGASVSRSVAVPQPAPDPVGQLQEGDPPAHPRPEPRPEPGKDLGERADQGEQEIEKVESTHRRESFRIPPLREGTPANEGTLAVVAIGHNWVYVSPDTLRIVVAAVPLPADVAIQVRGPGAQFSRTVAPGPLPTPLDTRTERALASVWKVNVTGL